MRKIILFDVDHTLIDTDKLRKLIRIEISKAAKVSEEVLCQIETEYTETLKSRYDFNPEDYLNFLDVHLHKEKKLIRQIFYKDVLYRKSLFPDVIEALGSLVNKFHLGVFSEAVLHNQLIKLEKSGTMKYFDRRYLFIFRRKIEKEVLSRLPEKAVLIDDNGGVLEEVHKQTGLNCIWLNRKDSHKHSIFPTIFSLLELEKLL
jgi:FMN phosphatase YigB (HAD superfamily)